MEDAEREEEQQPLTFYTWNERAYKNGCMVEEFAENFFAQIHGEVNVIRVNNHVDFFVCDRAVEVKSCQETIVDRSHSNRKRTGRFYLGSKERFDDLVNRDGLLFFAVTRDKEIVRFKIIPASILVYKHKVDWRTIWRYY